MGISTKTGDGGQTFLPSGERVSKNHPEINFLGTLDELNSHIGLLRTKGMDALAPDLKLVQKELLNLIAVPEEALHRTEENLKKLEAELPPLTDFILPGGAKNGTELAALTHIARTVCRRAERLSPAPSPYLNRLSDYLFMLARKCDTMENPET